MPVDLSTDEGLREACASALEEHRKLPIHDEWMVSLSAHLASFANVDEANFRSREMQRILWDSDAVSATGQGNIDVSRVIESPELTEHLWHLKHLALSPDREERSRQLSEAYEALREKVTPLVSRYTPRLKMYRVLATLFPSDFTTVAHITKLIKLGRAMHVRSYPHPVALHRRVLDRLSDVLGDAGPPLSRAAIERMALPWILFAAQVQERGDDATEIAGPVPGEETLKPLPADRRRRGLLAIAGLLPSILAMIEFAKDGCTREDFREHIRTVNPKLAEVSINTQINALIAEWGVLRVEGDQFRLTPRGEALLGSGDPEDVADWLLTRILGFDNLLYLLAQGPRSSSELYAYLKDVNPGWTTNFAPAAMVNWIRGLGLTESAEGKTLQLSETGRDWAGRIHWEPRPLTRAAIDTAGPAEPGHDGSVPAAIVRPPLRNIIATFPSTLRFADTLVARLDAGLWSHPRRHFAVLTGLSGAGKTQLAHRYALGLGDGAVDAAKRVLIVPVQPGWHDPSCLLGYVNPISSVESYVGTTFLNFLLEACADPERPYTAILDEMNLSHPEQYLAPLLSAMETGDQISLHTGSDDIGDVPPSMAYPSNLVLIGTVNMDETTHGLSDKVLDRAAVIEFWHIDVDAFPGWQACGLTGAEADTVRLLLGRLVQALQPVRLHFGWRTITDIIGYVREALAGGVIDFVAALDNAVYAKVLPKLRGEDSPRLRTALSAAKDILAQAELREAESKLDQLIDDLAHLGSARFWR